jgi:hypothetical protein
MSSNHVRGFCNWQRGAIDYVEIRNEILGGWCGRCFSDCNIGGANRSGKEAHEDCAWMYCRTSMLDELWPVGMFHELLRWRRKVVSGDLNAGLRRQFVPGEVLI